MYKVIVSGASGFIGSSLVRRLLEEDARIWALGRHFRDGCLPASERITLVKDEGDADEVKKQLEGHAFDAFYNLAWQGVNGPEKASWEVQLRNLALALRYAELAHSLGCAKYLCAGTIAERALESLPQLQAVSGGMMYGAAKACCRSLLETRCKQLGQKFVWMQFSNIYGPGNKTGNLISYTLEQLKNGKRASFGPALQPYDFLYVDELIEAVCRLGLSETTEDFYYIGSGKPRILAEYLRAVGDIFGAPELIGIGERPDDGIRYRYDMLDSSRTLSAIGDYISAPFEEHIRYTIEHD